MRRLTMGQAEDLWSAGFRFWYIGNVRDANSRATTYKKMNNMRKRFEDPTFMRVEDTFYMVTPEFKDEALTLRAISRSGRSRV